VASEVWGGRLDSREPIRFRPTLGLAVQNGDGRCRVTQVFPTGPAKPAGIEVGDIIEQFAGQKIASPDELTKFLWKKKPGDRVTLEIERNGKSKKIEMRLGQIAQSFPGSPEPPKEEEQDG
jgi:putative serine protease PepD